MVKNLLAKQETWVPSLGREDPLEKATSTHSSILAWRIPWTEEPEGLHTVLGDTKSHTRLNSRLCLAYPHYNWSVIVAQAPWPMNACSRLRALKIQTLLSPCTGPLFNSLTTFGEAKVISKRDRQRELLPDIFLS